MYLKKEAIQQLELCYGIPIEYNWKQLINQAEMTMLKASQKAGRSHDFTFFITNSKNQIAVIRKHRHPAGFYRAPSGGVDPGEDLLEGIHREVLEELGLKTTIKDYLLRIKIIFQYQDEKVPWVTHILTGQAKTDILQPIDIKEIKEAIWVSWEDLQGSIRGNLIRSPYGLFHYRVSLTDTVAKIYSDKVSQ